MGGHSHDMPCTWQLAVEKHWSARAGPFISLLTQMGIEKAAFVGAPFLAL